MQPSVYPLILPQQETRMLCWRRDRAAILALVCRGEGSGAVRDNGSNNNNGNSKEDNNDDVETQKFDLTKRAA